MPWTRILEWRSHAHSPRGVSFIKNKWIEQQGRDLVTAARKLGVQTRTAWPRNLSPRGTDGKRCRYILLKALFRFSLTLCLCLGLTLLLIGAWHWGSAQKTLTNTLWSGILLKWATLFRYYCGKAFLVLLTLYIWQKFFVFVLFFYMLTFAGISNSGNAKRNGNATFGFILNLTVKWKNCNVKLILKVSALTTDMHHFIKWEENWLKKYIAFHSFTKAKCVVFGGVGDTQINVSYNI